MAVGSRSLIGADVFAVGVGSETGHRRLRRRPRQRRRPRRRRRFRRQTEQRVEDVVEVGRRRRRGLRVRHRQDDLGRCQKKR